ncbi:hypothetical protein GGR53DRAFT_529898 [Hypoxylon sp. FL1150]|nr:hypothetical protein GGR53DRAFT_529898 [Hypoxylon sp. FL1150]
MADPTDSGPLPGLGKTLPLDTDFDGLDVRRFTSPGGDLGQYDRPPHWPPPNSPLPLKSTVYIPVTRSDLRDANGFVFEGLRICVNLNEIFKMVQECANLLRHEGPAALDYWTDSTMSYPCRPLWLHIRQQPDHHKPLESLFKEIVKVGTSDFYEEFRCWVANNQEADKLCPSGYEDLRHGVGLPLAYITTMKRVMLIDPDRFAEMDENMHDALIWGHSLDNWARAYVAMKRFLHRRKTKDFRFYADKRRRKTKGIMRLATQHPPPDRQPNEGNNQDHFINDNEIARANKTSIEGLALQRDLQNTTKIPQAAHEEYWSKWTLMNHHERALEAREHFNNIDQTLGRYLAREEGPEEDDYLKSMAPMTEATAEKMRDWLKTKSAEENLPQDVDLMRNVYSLVGLTQGAIGQQSRDVDWGTVDSTSQAAPQNIHNHIQRTVQDRNLRPSQTLSMVDILKKLHTPPYLSLHGSPAASGKTIVNAMLAYWSGNIPREGTRGNGCPWLYICAKSKVNDTYDELINAFPSTGNLVVKKMFGSRVNARNTREEWDTIENMDELVETLRSNLMNRTIIVTTYGMVTRHFHNTSASTTCPDVTWQALICDDSHLIVEASSPEYKTAYRVIQSLSYFGICCCSSQVVTTNPKTLAEYLELAPKTVTQDDQQDGLVSCYMRRCVEENWDAKKCLTILHETYESLLTAQAPPAMFGTEQYEVQVIPQQITLKQSDLSAWGNGCEKALAANTQYRLPSKHLSMSAFFPISRRLLVPSRRNAALRHMWRIAVQAPPSTGLPSLEDLAGLNSAGLTLDQLIAGYYNKPEDGTDALGYLYSYSSDSASPEPESRTAWLMWLVNNTPTLPAILTEVLDVTMGLPREANTPNNVVLVVDNHLTQLIMVFALRLIGLGPISVSEGQPAKRQQELINKFKNLSISDNTRGSIIILPTGHKNLYDASVHCRMGIMVNTPDTTVELDAVIDSMSNCFNYKTFTFEVMVHVPKQGPQQDKWKAIMLESAKQIIEKRQSTVVSCLRGDMAALVANELVRWKFGLENSLFLESLHRCDVKMASSDMEKDGRLKDFLSLLAQVVIGALVQEEGRSLWTTQYASLCQMTGEELLAVYTANNDAEERTGSGQGGLAQISENSIPSYLDEARQHKVDEKNISNFAMHAIGGKCKENKCNC